MWIGDIINKEIANLRDAGAERSLLATVITKGKDALIDAGGIISASDFSLPLNRTIFTCLEYLGEDPNCQVFDSQAIITQAKALGFGDQFQDQKNAEYLDLLPAVKSDIQNIPLFGLQIKKYSVARDLYQRYEAAQKYISNITGSEPLSEIIKNAEGSIVDFVTGEGSSKLTELGEGVDEYVERLIAAPEVDQIGIPTGFPIWDNCIGGGIRPGCVAITASRSKVGKSWHGMNVGRNVGKRGLPVLYLDSELTAEYQKSRILGIDSGVPIKLLETGQFNRNQNYVCSLRAASQRVKKYPITYQSISGMSHIEALAVARRWLVRTVGFNELGHANPCLIVYDYIKIANGKDLASFSPEHILLGLLITCMHEFAVRYNVPILAYAQLNRDGITETDTSIVAGSDRLLWLCSSLSIIRNKDDTDTQMNCGKEFGNKKLIPMETRHGPGLELEADYINLRASLRPGINEFEATGLMTEGLKFSDVINNGNQGQNDSGGSSREDRNPRERQY